VWLYFGDKRMEKRKTPVYKCTLEPVFNETFTFNVPWEKIRECSLDVRVMDFDNIGRNELIGRISLTGQLCLHFLLRVSFSYYYHPSMSIGLDVYSSFSFFFL
jgi:hypothetical protein